MIFFLVVRCDLSIPEFRIAKLQAGATQVKQGGELYMLCTAYIEMHGAVKFHVGIGQWLVAYPAYAVVPVALVFVGHMYCLVDQCCLLGVAFLELGRAFGDLVVVSHIIMFN